MFLSTKKKKKMIVIKFSGYFATFCMHQFSSVQSLSRVRLFENPWITARQASLSQTPGVHSNSCPSSQWCHPTTSSSVIPFSSCLHSFPASGSFPMSQLFAWGSQSIGVSALASFLPINTQDWSPLEWTGWISLQSKGLSRVFSNTIVQKHHRNWYPYFLVLKTDSFPFGLWDRAEEQR